MTVDQIKERSTGQHLNVSCPECGRIHLTTEDAEESAKRKHTESNRYLRIANQALASTTLKRMSGSDEGASHGQSLNKSLPAV